MRRKASEVSARRIVVAPSFASSLAQARAFGCSPVAASLRRTHLRVILAMDQVAMESWVEVKRRVCSRSTSRAMAAQSAETSRMSSRKRATAQRLVTKLCVGNARRHPSVQSCATQDFANPPARPTAASLSLATAQMAFDRESGENSESRCRLAWRIQREKRLAGGLQAGHLSAKRPRPQSISASSGGVNVMSAEECTFAMHCSNAATTSGLPTLSLPKHQTIWATRLD
mmetsp:Transcript_73290/g.238445  ORF Transcript_73290/g.238445 Transcript_73290/m.238445 type:complete len:229 (-) Transcript_73290:896-1582(-)